MLQDTEVEPNLVPFQTAKVISQQDGAEFCLCVRVILQRLQEFVDKRMHGGRYIGVIKPVRVFFENYALQCGYCSPGMIMTAKALLEHNPHPSRSEIADAISGNICRCTGYLPILDAIEDAAKRMNGGEA